MLPAQHWHKSYYKFFYWVSIHGKVKTQTPQCPLTRQYMWISSAMLSFKYEIMPFRLPKGSTRALHSVPKLPQPSPCQHRNKHLLYAVSRGNSMKTIMINSPSQWTARKQTGQVSLRQARCGYLKTHDSPWAIQNVFQRLHTPSKTAADLSVSRRPAACCSTTS